MRPGPSDAHRDGAHRAGSDDAATAAIRRLRNGSTGPYRPPVVPSYAVARRRLLFLLDVAAQQRLTTVVAPAGYGKSLLVSQWADTHRALRVRWLTVGEPDNDSRTFVSRLRAALDPDKGPASAGASGLPERPVLTPLPAVDSSLLERIERMPPTMLVLDDFQELRDPAALGELATLIEHAPRSLRTVISTQADPPSRFYHLSLSDSLVELRQRDLAFRTDEAAALFRNLAGIELPEEQVQRILERTEGWAAGLHLAALSLRNRDDVAGFVEELSGDDGSVAEYLAQHVFLRLPDAVREFLIRTSVVERMSGSLCDALTGRSDGQATLEYLNRRSIFITPCEPGPGWYRYHQLFRATLRRYLREEGADLERDLLRTAATWHIGRHDTDAGLRYLVEARAWSELFDHVSASGRQILAQNRASAVASLLNRTPRQIRSRRADALLQEAAGWAIGGRIGAAIEVLGEIDRAQVVSGGERTVAGLLRSFAALREGRAADAVAAADGVITDVQSHGPSESLPDVFGLIPDQDEILWAAHVIRGSGLLYQGLVEEARVSLHIGMAADHPMWQISALGGLAVAEAWSGRLGLAEQLATRSLALTNRSGLAHLVSPAAYVALAGVSREREDLERSGDWIAEGNLSLAANGDRVAASLLIVEQALLAGDEGRPESGLAALRSHRPRAQHPLPEAVVTRWHAAEARLMMASGQREAAAQALQMSPLRDPEVAALLVLLAIDSGDLGGARLRVAAWPTGPQPRAEVERGLMTAVLDHLEGASGPARDRMAAVAEACASEGWVGIFRRPHVVAAARHLYRESPTPFLRRVCEKPVAAGPSRRVRGMVEQLTDREYMVLPLLPTRLTNSEIAAALGVSLNTVKTHLKHIYRKLGVTERGEAIAAAEEMHLW